MEKNRRKILLITVLFSSLTAAHIMAQGDKTATRVGSIDFVVAVKTKLGVQKEVRVRRVYAKDPLLTYLSWTMDYLYQYKKYNFVKWNNLVLQQGEGIYLLIPWSLVKQITTNKDGHLVAIQGGQQEAGKVLTILESVNDETYDLSDSIMVNVVRLQPAHGKPMTKSAQDRLSDRWNLRIKGPKPRTFDVSSARFVIRYWSSQGYVMGGKDRETETKTFKVILDGSSSLGNLSDFEFISAKPNKAKTTVKVKAPGAEPVSGVLALFAKDSKGEHDASSWFIAADMQNGMTIASRGIPWSLERKKQPDRRTTQ